MYISSVNSILEWDGPTDTWRKKELHEGVVSNRSHCTTWRRHSRKHSHTKPWGLKTRGLQPNFQARFPRISSDAFLLWRCQPFDSYSNSTKRRQKANARPCMLRLAKRKQRTRLCPAWPTCRSFHEVLPASWPSGYHTSFEECALNIEDLLTLMRDIGIEVKKQQPERAQ